MKAPASPLRRRSIVLAATAFATTGVLAWPLKGEALERAHALEVYSRTCTLRVMSQRVCTAYLAAQAQVGVAPQLAVKDSLADLDRHLEGLRLDGALTEELGLVFFGAAAALEDLKCTVTEPARKITATRVFQLADRLLTIGDRAIHFEEPVLAKLGTDLRVLSVAGRQRMLPHRVASTYLASVLRVDDGRAEPLLQQARLELGTGLSALGQAAEGSAPLLREQMPQLLTRWQRMDAATRVMPASSGQPAGEVVATSEALTNSLDRIYAAVAAAAARTA